MVVFTVAALASAIRLCRRERFEGCLVIQGIPGAWVAMPLSSWFGMPYVVALVGADVPGFLPERFDRLHGRVAWLTRLTWRRAAGVAANSESLRALAERTAAPLGVVVDMVLYGADTTVFQPPATPRPDDVVRFLFVGRLSTQKGIRFLLEATARAANELRGRATIVVVGDGEDRDAVEARAREERLEGVIDFRGWLSREDLAKCYAEASVFVLPSLDEGRSQAALEAMASGLAVVATDIVGNAGLVEEGVNGVLVPPRDAAALAAALTTMVHLGPAKLAAMGDASRVRIGRFSWDGAAAHYLRSLEAAREAR